jgi:hypothetical protein
MAARKARPAAKRRSRVAAVRTRGRAVAPRRGRAVAPRRGRAVAPRRGRVAAPRRRGARANGGGTMCPAGMMMNAQGQCVPINGGYRRANTRGANRVTRTGYRKSGAALVYGGQNTISVGGVNYDCPPGVTYVGGKCVPISHGFSQSL